MSNILVKDVCENYNSKFVYISNATREIAQILKDECKCSKKTQVLNRVLTTGEIVNLNDMYVVYKHGSAIYSGASRFAPILINDYNVTREGTDFSI